MTPLDQYVAYQPMAAEADTKGDLRLRDSLKGSSYESAPVILTAYPDDEGVKNNGGRDGARTAPDTVLQYFLKMTPPGFSEESKLPSFFHVGNPQPDLSHFERLEAGRNACRKALEDGKHWIGIGGGHDYGYSEGMGFLDALSKGPKPLIINFDAHLDVREFDENSITSGTPFSRLLNSGFDFEFLEIGVQDFCNRRAHAEWARQKGAKILSMDDLRKSENPLGLLQVNISGGVAPTRPCFLSLDIDVFSSSLAMGCSQSWPSGMTLEEFRPLWSWLLSNFDNRVLGIYEVSPALDLDDRTSKLAAEIMYEYLKSLPSKGHTS